MTTTYVYGKNSVRAVLQTDPQRVSKLYLSTSLRADKRVDELYDLARQHNVPYQQVPPQKLDGMLKDDPEASHQGVIAVVTPRKRLELEDLIERSRKDIEAGRHPLVLMLDGITDPRNFGAILRVADAAGIAGVVISRHHSAGFGPAVSKTASGADATVDVVTVTNLVQAMEKFKAAGFWSVGTSLKEKSQPYTRQDYKMPTLLLMGSEEKGLSRLVEEHCDFLVKIPMQGVVDSLNVSAATAVLVFEMRRQQAAT